MPTKKSAAAGSVFRRKPKKIGKAKKSFGPKDQKPKKYRGQGRWSQKERDRLAQIPLGLSYWNGLDLNSWIRTPKSYTPTTESGFSKKKGPLARTLSINQSN